MMEYFIKGEYGYRPADYDYCFTFYDVNGELVILIDPNKINLYCIDKDEEDYAFRCKVLFINSASNMAVIEIDDLKYLVKYDDLIANPY